MRTLDERKIKKILSSLKRHPEGTYVSEIARETGLAKSTVSFLLSKHLSGYIQVIKLGRKNLFKIIKLKRKALRS